jgi:hypothetical protein
MQYWYELFLDDLPMWGFVGERKQQGDGPEELFVFTHKVIEISFNKDRVSSTCHSLTLCHQNPGFTHLLTLHRSYKLTSFQTILFY